MGVARAAKRPFNLDCMLRIPEDRDSDKKMVGSVVRLTVLLDPRML